MRDRLIAFFGIGLAFACAQAPTRFPSSDVAPVNACQAKVASEVRSGEAKVPRYLYHYGRKSVLDRDVAERTIPAVDWRDGIFGGKSAWSLPRFRRGLYGTERALRADPFANPADPSFVRIEVSESCRRSTGIATTIEIHRDPRFIEWAGADRTASFVRDCVKADGRLRVRAYGKFDTEPPTPRVRDCEAKIDAFLDGAGIRIVQDEAVDASWYVRDRGCIHRIEGTDSEIIGFFAAPDFFAPDRCGRADDSSMTFRIFISRVLIRRPDPKLLEGTFSNWKAARLEVPPTSEWIGHFSEAYRRCYATSRLDELARAWRESDATLGEIRDFAGWATAGDEIPLPPFEALCR